MSVGSILVGLSWIFSARVDHVFSLYWSYGVLGGIGSGIIYVGVVGLMVRWFPRRRGLAAGLVAAGYGAGAIFTTFPIATMIASSGYAHALSVFGLIQGAVGLIAAQGLIKAPAATDFPRVGRSGQCGRMGRCRCLKQPPFGGCLR